MKSQIISLAKKAIKIKSISTNKEKLFEVIDLFIDQFKPGSIFEIKRFVNCQKPSVIIKPKSKNPKIWLNAHLDVVPGKAKLFCPKITRNRLLGRGALDMKTAAACLTLSTKKLITQGFNLGLMLVTDEEVGGHHGTKFLIDKKIVMPEFVIVGEPTDLEIGIKSKGIISLQIISQGKSAHGSRHGWGRMQSTIC